MHSDRYEYVRGLDRPKELQGQFGVEAERIVATAKEQLVGTVPGLATAEAIRME
jgi:hypothetical protein